MIAQEVKLFIQSMKNRGEVIRPAWVTNAIVRNHPGIKGKDADWYKVCAYSAVRAEVRANLQKDKLRPEAEPDAQKLLPGFKRLQKYYLVARGHDDIAVPIDRLTLGDQREKIAELEKMGRGCFLHADELRRYFGLDERKAS